MLSMESLKEDNKKLDSIWHIIVQYFTVKQIISTLYFISGSSFLSLFRVWFSSLCWGPCALCILDWKGDASAKGCNIWLETACFRLCLFLEVMSMKVSNYTVLHSLVWKALPPFPPDHPPPPEHRTVASRYQRLKSAICHREMQK